jgi:hypothetical protein
MSAFASRPDARRYNAPRLLAGALVLLFGVGWLLQALGIVSFPWDVLLPVALVVTGAAVVWHARAGRRSGGLVALGIVLTVLLLVGTLIDVPLQGGVGDRKYRPGSFAALRPEYELAVGDLSLGLRDLPSSVRASRTVHVRLGMGRMTVHVASDAVVQVLAHAEVGRVEVFDRAESGFDVDVRSLPSIPAGGPVLTLDLSIGVGEIRVFRG